MKKTKLKDEIQLIIIQITHNRAELKAIEFELKNNYNTGDKMYFLRSQSELYQRIANLERNYHELINLIIDEEQIDSKFIHSNSALKYLLPAKRREEIIGDLIEAKMQMIEEGFPMWKIKMILWFQKAGIILSLFRVKLSDYGTAKKKVDQDN